MSTNNSVINTKPALSIFNESGSQVRLADIIDGYFELNLNGRFTYLNKSMLNLLGYSQYQVLSKPISNFINVDSFIEFNNCLEEIIKSGQSKPELIIHFARQDGQHFAGESSISVINDGFGHPVGFRVIVRNKTEEIAERKALIKSIVESTKLIHKLKSTNSFKDLLLDIIMHDIKNPLTVISGVTSYLSHEKADSEELELINKCSQDILDIIETDDYLINIATDIPLEKETIDIEIIVHKAIEEITPHIISKNINIINNINTPSPIKTNKLLKEAIKRYIMIAYKYSDPSTNIFIDAARNNHILTLEILNQGRIIQIKEYEDIINKDTLSDNLNENRNSQNLIIVAKIIHALGGECEIEPFDQTGNRLSFKIPDNLQAYDFAG